jgi:hypothetical protein
MRPQIEENKPAQANPPSGGPNKATWPIDLAD